MNECFNNTWKFTYDIVDRCLGLTRQYSSGHGDERLEICRLGESCPQLTTLQIR